MKKILLLLLVSIFVLNSCASVPQENEAAPESIVDHGISEEAAKENGNSEQAAVPFKEDSASSEQEKEDEKDSQTVSIPNSLGGNGWTVSNAFLYGKDAYYSAWHRDGDVYSFKLRLGGDNKPKYLGKGAIIGIYGSLLLADFDDQTMMKDLSQKDKKWETLSFSIPAGRNSFGGDQDLERNFSVTNSAKTRNIQYQNQFWLFRTECVYVVDTAEKTVKKIPLEKSIQAAYIDGNDLYYSIIDVVNPIVDETVVYKTVLPSKKSKELLRFSSKADWRYANGRILVFEDDENPIVFDVESGKRIATTDLLEAGGKIVYTNHYNGSVIAEYGTGVLPKERYWLYDLSTWKETILEGREGLPSIYYTFADGNYYYTGAENTMTVLVNGKQYTVKSPDGKSKFGVNAANQYGAVVGAAGAKAGLYTVVWDEDESYVLCPLESHVVPWE